MMKKIVVTIFIFCYSNVSNSADPQPLDDSIFGKLLPEEPMAMMLREKINQLTPSQRMDAQNGDNVNRCASPHRQMKVGRVNSPTQRNFRLVYSEKKNRDKNRIKAKNAGKGTYLNASMADNYQLILDAIKAFNLPVQVEETYLVVLEEKNNGYDDSRAAVMQEVSPSIKISTRGNLELSETIVNQMLALIHHAQIWCPDRAFKVKQQDKELKLVVSACMIHANYGDFWEVSEEEKASLRRMGYINLQNYFNQAQEQDLAELVTEYVENNDKAAV